MQDNLAYRYFAFISYSSDDKRLTKKIQDKIESYRLPTVLRNELEAATGKKYPQRVQPLCRDDTDLSAGLLGKSILRELEDSRFLLVICSPNSAKSEWVNQEVENFILMGRYERIIPYIIEGTPNSGDPATECFPPILRKNREFISYSHLKPEENAERQAKLHALLDDIHDELKGVSLFNEGARNSRLKAIARMLDVSPDTLIQRDRQRQKKRIIWSSITALVFMVLFTCLGLWTWDRYYRVHVGYFADYVEYWGVPRGIFPLTPEQRAHRQEHYRIYTQNQKVIRLEHVNSAGTPISVKNTEFRDRPMIAVYPLYKKNGQLVQKDSLDKNGRIIMSYLYSGDKMEKAEFKSVSNNGKNDSMILNNITSLTKSVLDISLETAHSNIGNMNFVRDSKGFISKALFQKAGYDIPTTDEQGIAGFEYKRDEYGRIVEIIYLNLDGKPHPDKQGVVCRKYTFDNKGNLVETQYLDANGKLTFNELGWMHRINTFDGKGNCIEEKFVDSSGALCLNNDQIAGWNCTYDDQGNPTVISYFGINRQPCLFQGIYVKVTKKYDEFGNIIEQAFFGLDNKPCMHSAGYAKITWKYDERGNSIEEAYFGIDGNPCKGDVRDVARVAWKYDKWNNKIEETYFDVNGKPCVCDGGHARITVKYDSQGHRIEQAYYDLENKPCLSCEGLARFTEKYDERGNLVEMVFYDIDDKPCARNDGSTKITIKYDERRNIVEFAFYGIDQKLKAKYDEWGNKVEVSFCDINDNLCLGMYGGFARATMKYDERGNMIESAVYGIDNQPCLHNDMVAGYKYQYNEKNQEIRTEFIDLEGKPCVLGGDNPYKVLEKTYHENGKVAKKIWHYPIMPYKNVLGKMIDEYDERGNLTSTCFLNMDDQPCLCDEGYSKEVLEYNERGYNVKEAYFGADGKPCLHQKGYAKIAMEYDEQGNLIEGTYYGVDDKPRLCDDGYAIIKQKYDNQGNLTELTFFDADGKPCLHKDGHAKTTITPDEQGDGAIIEYFNIDGKPCMHKEGYAKVIQKTDKQGNVTFLAFFGVDNQLCLSNKGFAIGIAKYNDRGKTTEEAYFGDDGKPCLIKDGYAKAILKYNDQGNKTEEAYFDVDGNPCLSTDGYAKVVLKYNDQGYKSEEAFFDADGKPCLSNEGYAKAVPVYDKNRVLTNITYFDIHGKELPNHVKIDTVFPGSYGEELGIQDGDFIILYDGQPYDNHNTFIEKRAEETGDDLHELIILRDKEFVVIKAHPGKLGCSLGMRPLPEDRQKLVMEKLKELKKDTNPPETE